MSARIIDNDFREQGTEFLGDIVCAMGFFDGVHIGHRKLISECIEAAKARGCQSAIITFDIDPVELFAVEPVRKLMADKDRIELLASTGVDIVIVEKFSKEFSELPPDDYIHNVMLSKMNPVELFVGKNFKFGHRAAGNISVLDRELKSHGWALHALDLVDAGGERVSATRIRNLIEDGKIELANELLARTHWMRAKVVTGRQEGRKLGFPTANLQPCIEYAQMADGVYAGYVKVGERFCKSATSVGVPKTFGDVAWTIEAHLLDFSEDIYGKEVEVYFSKYLRPMQTFSSLDELIDAINGNVSQARQLPDFEG